MHQDVETTEAILASARYHCPANIVFIQGEKIVLGTFRTSSWLRKYSPGVENTFEDTLYSCSLVDAPGYDDHPRTWPCPDKVPINIELIINRR